MKLICGKLQFVLGHLETLIPDMAKNVLIIIIRHIYTLRHSPRANMYGSSIPKMIYIILVLFGQIWNRYLDLICSIVLVN